MLAYVSQVSHGVLRMYLMVSAISGYWHSECMRSGISIDDPNGALNQAPYLIGLVLGRWHLVDLSDSGVSDKFQTSGGGHARNAGRG